MNPIIKDTPEEGGLPGSTQATERKTPFASRIWIPLSIGGGSLGLFVLTLVFGEIHSIHFLAWPALAGVGATLLYFLVQCVARGLERQWKKALFAFLRLAGFGCMAFLTLASVTVLSFIGQSEDHFADNLTIPKGIDIAEPDPMAIGAVEGKAAGGNDELQAAVRAALAVPGGDVAEFTPHMPSLRRAATDHAKAFRDYIEASPDWHVFIEQGNRFAARRWSYGGEPRDTLHGYISEFGGDAGFQTRCLLCLDLKQWSRYSVQHVEDGPKPVVPKLSRGNNLHESRVMIECGGIWVELFEQSGTPERRVTKATVIAVEKEFSEFERDPEAALAGARARSRALAGRLAGTDGHPFRLVAGMQPGIYGVVYSLNPGEPGSVYLKASEVTKGTRLSPDRLEGASKTRMTWSTQSAERFGAKAGFTIYEGDWGKPYAARFEVWFKPDSGKADRKLAERIFKIEGWQR
ncbi:MAG: hypothetical protein DVB31_06975 [Verrucomicrobia bacterium]|nr:MAG: hypothetical protein DVB31_06975 [Verrucomicrobiota bacterium]